jgi:hypothetical protein
LLTQIYLREAASKKRTGWAKRSQAFCFEFHLPEVHDPPQAERNLSHPDLSRPEISLHKNVMLWTRWDKKCSDSAGLAAISELRVYKLSEY